MNETHSDAGADLPQAELRGKLLDSWKEIAAYLNRDVATVRRWEKREALPVHRHLHEKQGSVFAYTSELDVWREGRRQQLEPQESTAVTIPLPLRQRVWPWIAATLAAGLALVLALWAPWQVVPSPATLRLNVELGADASLTRANVQFGGTALLSPDGTAMVFVAQKGDGRPQLYVRQLNELNAAALPGTDDALSPFFSPDGRWIGFFARNKLKKIAVTGGAIETLSDAPSNRGGAWGEDDTIVFSPNQTAGTCLLRISSSGGNAEPLVPLVDGEVIQAWPQIMPGGKAVLYTSSGVAGAYGDADLVVQTLPNGPRKVVHRGGYHGRYLPSGHLVYIHHGTLFAAPFDLGRLEMTGPPVPVIEGVNANSLTGGAQFAVSANGTLLYLPGLETGAANPIQWMDHHGKTTPLRATRANWFTPRFSPDGSQLAMEIREAPLSDIWVYEWAQDKLTRVTSDSATDQTPVWTPGGRGIVFASPRTDKLTPNLYWQRADGTGGAKQLTESTNVQSPSSWHPSGKFLAFEETTGQTKSDIMILPLEGDDDSGWTPGKPWPFLHDPWVEYEPMFSPDGRWLAYTSIESGRPEVYVRPFPGPGGKWLIGAGANPTWSRTTRELFYGAEGQIKVASFTVDGNSFRPGEPRLWSEGRYQVRGTLRMFDLHRDGERFALALAEPTPSSVTQAKAVFIFNFFDELRRAVSPTKR